MNSAKVIKLASHCVQTFYWMQRMETYLCSGGRCRRWRRDGWLFPFSSVASSSFVFGVVFLVSVLSPLLAFLSVSFFLFEIVFEKKAFGLCFRIPLLWTNTMMVRVLESGVGWTQAFSGSVSSQSFSSVFFFYWFQVLLFLQGRR